MPSTIVDSILWDLITLHTDLVNKWLLREFRSRGAPPVTADMEIILKLSNVIDMIREGGFKDAARDLIGVLEYITTLPPFSIPEHFCKIASDCLEKVNARCEEVSIAEGFQPDLGSGETGGKELEKSVVGNSQDIDRKDTFKNQQEDNLIEEEDEDKDKEWVQVIKDEREVESGEWDNVVKGDEEVEEDVRI